MARVECCTSFSVTVVNNGMFLYSSAVQNERRGRGFVVPSSLRPSTSNSDGSGTTNKEEDSEAEMESSE